MPVQSKATSSVKEAFENLHSEIDEKNIKEIKMCQEDYKIHGLISTEGHRSKQFQYVYVNRRLVKKSHLMKIINLEFKVFKSQKMYPVFALFLECPQNKLDFTFEPRKTEVLFEQPQEVYSLIQNAISEFLNRHSSLLDRHSIPSSSQIKPREADVKRKIPCFLPNVTGIEPLREKEKRNFLDHLQGHLLGLFNEFFTPCFIRVSNLAKISACPFYFLIL